MDCLSGENHTYGPKFPENKNVIKINLKNIYLEKVRKCVFFMRKTIEL